MMTVELKSVGVRARVFTVSTLREASKVCREFIAEHSLGNSTWQGGLVRVNGKRAYNVSYNGRVWVYSSKGWTPETTEVLRDDLDKRF